MGGNIVEVSVLIPTYKQEKYIRQTLDSVFIQKTNFEFEVIVGEDASPDNTRKILLEYKKKYGDKLVLVLHDKNLGPSGNSQSIGKLARGKYIATVEGDDFWTDEYKLQKQYDILEKHPEYSAVCHDIMGVSSNGDIITKSYLKLRKDIVKTMNSWINEGYTVHTCSIFRRRYKIDDMEKYDKLRTAEPTMGDLISFTLLYDMGDIYVIKDIMAAHRSAGKDDTSSFSYAQKTQAIYYSYMFIRIIRNLEKYFDYKYDLSNRICSRIASVKYDKLRGGVVYKRKEMKALMKTLSVKLRIKVYVVLLKQISDRIRKKIRGLYVR